MTTYKDILSLTYSEARKKYPEYESLSTTSKIVAMKNHPELPTYRTDSDVIVYYDVIGDSTPLLLIERIKKSWIQMVKLMFEKRKWNRELDGYVVTIKQRKAEKFIDIYVLKSNLYESFGGEK